MDPPQVLQRQSADAVDESRLGLRQPLEDFLGKSDQPGRRDRAESGAPPAAGQDLDHSRDIAGPQFGHHSLLSRGDLRRHAQDALDYQIDRVGFVANGV